MLTVVVAGIFLTDFLFIDPGVLLVSCLFQFLFLIILYRNYFNWISYRRRWVYGIFVYLFYFSLAFSVSSLKNEKYFSSHFSTYSGIQSLSGTISGDPAITSSGKIRCILAVSGIYAHGISHACEGHLLLYLEKKDSLKIGYGDRLKVFCKPSPINSPKNPGQFDYRCWLARRQVFHQAFVRKEQYSVTARGEGSRIKQVCLHTRDKLLRNLHLSGISGQEYAVLSAILLGYEEDIDRETMDHYSASGVIHILSVSGMHVGIIYSVIWFLTGQIRMIKKSTAVRHLLVIITVWLYAGITGASPSVLRASAMLGFVSAGKIMSRQAPVFNSLAVSVFILLLAVDTGMLYYAGFQLSCLAVAGIVWLYAPLYNRLYFSSTWMDKIWSIVAVSIAAQLFTFPLSVYYFHMFPNYFLPANLIIIPLSTLVMFSGMALFVIPEGMLLRTAGHLGYFPVHYLNEAASFFSQLPGSVSRDIPLTMISFILLSVAVFYTGKFLVKARPKFLLKAILFINALLLCYVCRENSLRKSRTFIVFSSEKNDCVGFRLGNEAILLTDSLLHHNPSMIRNLTGGWSMEQRVSPEVISFGDSQKNPSRHLNQHLITGSSFIQFDSLKIALIRENPHKKIRITPDTADIAVVYGNAMPDDLPHGLFVRELVCSGTVRKSASVKWMKFCKEKNISCHPVSSKGAYIRYM